MDREQLSYAAMRLANDAAFIAVRETFQTALTKEVMAHSTSPERRIEALAEYYAFDRIKRAIDQLAQAAITKETTG